MLTLPPRVIVSEPKSSPEEVFGKGTICFRYGRDAMYHGLKSLGLGPGHQILAPAYFCDAVARCFLNLGVGVTLYALDRSLAWDPAELESKIDDRTAAIFLIHFFGFPQGLEEARKICEKHGLLLVEDCAHTFLGSWQGKPLGEFGDVAIFSFRKFLPTPDGGGIRFNDYKRVTTRLNMRRDGRYALQAGLRVLKLMANHLMMDLPPQVGNPTLLHCRKGWLGKPSILRLDAEGSREGRGLAMSRLSEYIGCRVDLTHLVAQRRRNFGFWQENLSAFTGWTPLFRRLDPRVVPWAFPAIIPERDRILARLDKAGLFFHPLMGEPKYRLRNVLNPGERFQDLEYLTKHLLSLPVHQTLTLRRMEKIKRRIVRALCN